MNSLYLKLLNDFCHSGNVPSAPSDAIEGKPWVIKKDPLMDFLLKLMGEVKYKTIDYLEEISDRELTDEELDKIHDFYSQLK